MTLKMTSTKVIEMSVTFNNSLSQDYTNPDDQITTNMDTPGFRSFTVLLSNIVIGNKKSESKAKEYEFKPIEKDNTNEEGSEERESNEDITDQLEELEKLESLGDVELKELVMKFFHER